ncbi:hypothetical protein QWZ08_13235 [Ferruginibacter paludis]|uniref:hypothetical protein n=1 Tax=Ferruginibacter paludis TaxID=1310417 RepID=UPI0025B44667|nr:hypothetical protein [Ferruginibacter paludis]MDN3656602.1 hypothetical protein [Ferruginibacter paludis]
MVKTYILLAFVCMGIVATRCNSSNDSNKKYQNLKFESVNDSLYQSDENYKQGLATWKQYYEHCMNQPLFADAFYLQLQDKINIGSINNAHATDITKGLKILDTAKNKNLFHLLAIMNSANCSDTLPLSNHLRKDFYTEITKLLSVSTEYKNLPANFDSTQMSIRVGTLYYDALRPDTLISTLNRTTDSSLLRYKELLLRPENALLAQTVYMIGFSAELPLKIKPGIEQEAALKKGVSFSLNTSNDKINMVLLSNNHVRLQVNKRYTVLGKFLKLKVN